MKNIYLLKINDFDNNDIVIYLARTKRKALSLAKLHLIYRNNGKELYTKFKNDEYVEFKNEFGNDIDFELTKEPLYE